MSIFDKRVQVYGPEEMTVGEFDPTVDGCYRNVLSIPLDVKPNRFLHVRIRSDFPVDVVVAKEDHSSAGHKDQITDAELGPYPTEKSRSMGILIGVFRGDRAKVTVEAWTDKE